MVKYLKLKLNINMKIIEFTSQFIFEFTDRCENFGLKLVKILMVRKAVCDQPDTFLRAFHILMVYLQFWSILL